MGNGVLQESLRVKHNSILVRAEVKDQFRPKFHYFTGCMSYFSIRPVLLCTGLHPIRGHLDQTPIGISGAASRIFL